MGRKHALLNSLLLSMEGRRVLGKSDACIEVLKYLYSECVSANILPYMLIIILSPEERCGADFCNAL